MMYTFGRSWTLRVEKGWKSYMKAWWELQMFIAFDEVCLFYLQIKYLCEAPIGAVSPVSPRFVLHRHPTSQCTCTGPFLHCTAWDLRHWEVYSTHTVNTSPAAPNNIHHFWAGDGCGEREKECVVFTVRAGWELRKLTVTTWLVRS